MFFSHGRSTLLFSHYIFTCWIGTLRKGFQFHTSREKFTCMWNLRFQGNFVSHTEFHMVNLFHMHFTYVSLVFHTFASSSDSDKLLDSPSKLPCYSLVKHKENLTLHQKSLRALFHGPLQLVKSLPFYIRLYQSSLKKVPLLGRASHIIGRTPRGENKLTKTLKIISWLCQLLTVAIYSFAAKTGSWRQWSWRSQEQFPWRWKVWTASKRRRYLNCYQWKRLPPREMAGEKWWGTSYVSLTVNIWFCVFSWCFQTRI